VGGLTFLAHLVLRVGQMKTGELVKWSQLQSPEFKNQLFTIDRNLLRVTQFVQHAQSPPAGRAFALNGERRVRRQNTDDPQVASVPSNAGGE
jgi:hypothetical protein